MPAGFFFFVRYAATRLLRSKLNRQSSEVAKRNDQRRVERHVDHSAVRPGGDHLSRGQPAAARGEVVREPNERPQRMAVGMLAVAHEQLALRRVDGDTERCQRQLQSVDYHRTDKEALVGDAVGKEFGIAHRRWVGVSGSDELEHGMRFAYPRVHLRIAVGRRTRRKIATDDKSDLRLDSSLSLDRQNRTGRIRRNGGGENGCRRDLARGAWHRAFPATYRRAQKLTHALWNRQRIRDIGRTARLRQALAGVTRDASGDKMAGSGIAHFSGEVGHHGSSLAAPGCTATGCTAKGCTWTSSRP